MNVLSLELKSVFMDKEVMDPSPAKTGKMVKQCMVIATSPG